MNLKPRLAIASARRFAGCGFKRQVPAVPHITDFVSFPLKCVIDPVPPQESAEAQAGRAHKRAYLEERNYRVITVSMAEVEKKMKRASRGQFCPFLIQSGHSH